eukprot:6172581-Pleurochrysis_carterae.AAC.3
MEAPTVRKHEMKVWRSTWHLLEQQHQRRFPRKIPRLPQGVSIATAQPEEAACMFLFDLMRGTRKHSVAAVGDESAELTPEQLLKRAALRIESLEQQLMWREEKLSQAMEAQRKLKDKARYIIC